MSYSDVQKAPFLFLNDHPNQYFESIDEKMNKGYKQLNNIDATDIIKNVLFSPRNVDIIQKMVVSGIHKKFNILIPYQKLEHVNQAISGIYHTYAQNLPFGLKEQIKELDLKIAITLINAIATELYARTRYLESIETAKYIDLPKYVGAKGQRTLPSLMPAIGRHQ